MPDKYNAGYPEKGPKFYKKGARPKHFAKRKRFLQSSWNTVVFDLDEIANDRKKKEKQESRK
jgi:hypothetical protein